MHKTRQHKGNEQDRAVCLKTTNENEPELNSAETL